MYLNVLSEIKFFMLNTNFCYNNALLPFNWSFVALIKYLTLIPFSRSNINR